MPLGDLCTDPAFLDAWGECFESLPLELLRSLAVLNRAWNVRLVAHFLTYEQRVRFGKEDCTNENAAFLLGLVRRCTGRMINHTLLVTFGGFEDADEPEPWVDFDLHDWLQKHLLLGTVAKETPDATWRIDEDMPLAAAFLLGRAAALDVNQLQRRIDVALPFTPRRNQDDEPMRKTLHPWYLCRPRTDTVPQAPLDRFDADHMSNVGLTALAGCCLKGTLHLLRTHDLSNITLERQRLDDEGARAVAGAMHAMSATPRSLKLKNTITKLSMGMLGPVLNLVPRGDTFCTKYLNTLDLSQNELGPTGIERLSRMFMSCRWKQLPELKHLDLSNCAIGCAAMDEHLAPCFATEMVLGGLKSLKLKNNPIGKRGLGAFQSRARGMTALERLELMGCVTMPSAIQDFAVWLKRDAKWVQIKEVQTTYLCPQDLHLKTFASLKTDWEKAQYLVQQAVNVHTVERAWKEALPTRLNFD
jgi:hypothetical protein